MSYVINTKLVYIVDDERALQIGVREVIRRAGLEIEIETFYDPNEAFDVSPYVQATFEYFLRNPICQAMGRKIKPAFSSSENLQKFYATFHQNF